MESALEQANRAWASKIDGRSQADVDESVRGTVALTRDIANEGSLSAGQFASLMKFDIETAKETFAELSSRGIQTDETGRIAGPFVTTVETPFKLRVSGTDLYAWSALYSLFIPGILASAAQLESRYPITGKTIRIGVSGRRITSLEPGGIWLSVFLPSDFSREIGPESPACSQTHCFYDRSAADEWVTGRVPSSRSASRTALNSLRC